MVNSWMDALSVDLGASHRRQRHDYWFTPLQACSIYKDYGFQLVAAMVLQHLKLDGLISPEEERSWHPEEAETKLEEARSRRNEEEKERLIKEERRKLAHEKWLEAERKRTESDKREGFITTCFAFAGFALGALITLSSFKTDNVAFSLLLFFLGGCVGVFVALGFDVLTSPIRNLKLKGTIVGVSGGLLFGYFFTQPFSTIPAMIIYGFVGGFVGLIIGTLGLQKKICTKQSEPK